MLVAIGHAAGIACLAWVANNKRCQLANKNCTQTFALRNLGCTRHNASLLAVDNLSCYKVVGANYLAFSQFGYIFYVLSMPIESTKELCAYGRFLNGKRS